MNHFRAISRIPRCSYSAEEMKRYIRDFAQNLGYQVSEDKAGNVLCQRGNPKICLQAHYDMVCIGETAHIELIQEGNILKAKNSTLGADNGMGMAIIFTCMEEFEDLEALFTADEEVGLIGASNFALPLLSQRLLNLDGELEGEIYIGCAGGVDVIATLALDILPLDRHEKIYEIRAIDFLGGHSGVDIDKHIASATKVLASALSQYPVKLIAFKGGERRNAIPQSAVAIVASPEEIKITDSRLHVRELTEHYGGYLKQSQTILKSICAFAQGVREWDRGLDIPSISINLGLVNHDEKFLRIDCAARAMDNESLAILADETCHFFEGFGFDVITESWHDAWKPEVGAFAQSVYKAMQQEYGQSASYKAIHAGLECGVLIASQSKKIEAVSIGPTIRYPHSLREECDIDSVERMVHVIKKIIKG